MDQDGGSGSGRRSGKFKPKSSARRSQTQREQEEQAEAARKRQREIEAGRVTDRRSTRGGLSRTRGNAQFRGGLSSWRNESQATGFLGGAIASAPVESSLFIDDHSDSEPVSRAPVRARRETDKTPARKKKGKNVTADEPASLQIKDEENETTNPSGNGDFEAKHGINIDDLAYNNLISDEETEHKDEHIPHKVLYPVRLKRKADIDKKATVETNDESKASEQIQQEAFAVTAGIPEQQMITDNIDDDLKVTRTVDVGKRRNRTRRGRASDIKEEEDSKPDISTQRVSRAGRSGAREYINVSDDDALESVQVRPAIHNNKLKLFSKPVLQSPEDHEEWQRHQADMRAIAEELGPDNDGVPGQSINAAGKQKESQGRRDENVYLLQLPPVMPNLQAQFNTTPDEPDESMQGLTLSNDDQNPATAQGETREAPVKIEDDAAAMEAESSSKLELSLNASSKSNFKGPIGSLTVYKSGDTVLDWGGIEFQLERGMSSMLQESLLIDDESGAAYSMSQVAATFIVKPHWDALFEARA